MDEAEPHLLTGADDIDCLIDDFTTIDENEFWAVWNSNNEQNSKKRSEEDAKAEKEDAGLAAKRKQEVLSILSGYKNDLKKKKQKIGSSSESDEAAFSIDKVLNEMKRRRLEAFDPIIDAFNIGDFEMMGTILNEKCEENVILSSQLLSEDSVGKKAILLFWGLLHETYPDAMIQILETRLSTVSRASFHASSKPRVIPPDIDNSTVPTDLSASSSSQDPADSPYVGQYHSVEYVYKFTGTRITDRPVGQTFNKLIQSGILNDDVKYNNESLTFVISKYMTSVDLPPAAFVAHGCSYVVETVLTFNQHNKIIKWSYAILAAEVN